MEIFQKLLSLAGIFSTPRVQQFGGPVPGHAKFRPTGAALRNPSDPVQAERIRAAEAKRVDRAVKAQRNYDRCIGGGV